MRVLTVLAAVLVVLGAVLFGVAVSVSSPLFDEPLAEPPAPAFDVLPVSEALTFARTLDGRLLLVRSADRDSVEAVDLSGALGLRDPLEALRAVGFQAIAAQPTQPVLGQPGRGHPAGAACWRKDRQQQRFAAIPNRRA